MDAEDLALLLVAGAALVLAGSAGGGDGELVGGEEGDGMDLKAKTRQALRLAAERWSIDPNLLDAISRVETGGTYDPTLVNMTGADGAAGGAWGPTQMLKTTLARLGGGDDPSILQDPEAAAYWSCLYLARRPGGAPATVADAAAYWNAGRTTMAQVPADNTARTVYWPKLERAYAAVVAEGAGIA